MGRINFHVDLIRAEGRITTALLDVFFIAAQIGVLSCLGYSLLSAQLISDTQWRIEEAI